MKNINTKKFWDFKISTEKSKLQQSPIYKDKILFAIKNLKHKTGNILNIGVGYGILEEQLVNIKSKLNLYGIDISLKAIEMMSNYRGDFRIGSALRIPFNKNKFDNVALLDVIEHFEKNKINNIFIEVKRVLKSGGYLFLSVPLNESGKDAINNGHVTKFSQKSIATLISNNGFVIKDKKEFYAFKENYLVKSVIAKILKIRKPNLIFIIARKK